MKIKRFTIFQIIPVLFAFGIVCSCAKNPKTEEEKKDNKGKSGHSNRKGGSKEGKNPRAGNSAAVHEGKQAAK